jgi:hypothetical protein
MVVLLVIVVLIILSLMFGGFQKGTKSGGLGPLGPGPVGSGVHALHVWPLTPGSASTAISSGSGSPAIHATKATAHEGFGTAGSTNNASANNPWT